MRCNALNEKTWFFLALTLVHTIVCVVHTVCTKCSSGVIAIPLNLSHWLIYNFFCWQRVALVSCNRVRFKKCTCLAIELHGCGVYACLWARPAEYFHFHLPSRIPGRAHRSMIFVVVAVGCCVGHRKVNANAKVICFQSHDWAIPRLVVVGLFFILFLSLSRERALAGLTPINIAMHMHARQEKPIESFHFSHILYIVRHEYFMVNFEATAAAFAPRNKSRGIQLQVQWIHSMPLQFYDRIFFCVWRIPCMHSAKW